MSDVIEATSPLATSPAATVLPKGLMLKLENLSLKMQNVQLQLQVMNTQLGQALDAKNRLQVEMEELRAEVLKDHGVDVATSQISFDGIVSGPRTNGAR
jgi:hypothetical protein